MTKLLPFKYKIAGLTFVAGAICLTGVYFYSRLKIEVPDLAIISFFLKTNFIKEIIVLLFLVGFSLTVFSKEKNEKKWFLHIRARALTNTIAIYIAWLAVSIIFIFGSAFVSLLILNIVLPFLIYIVVFYCIKYKTCKRRKIRILQQKLFRKQF